MAMKFKFKSKDEIPAGDLSRYVERDGAWYLDVEDAVEKSKHDEQRAIALAAVKERDEDKKRFEGIDPEEVRKLAEEKRRLEEAQALAAGQFDKVMEARLKAQKAELDKQVSTLNARLVAVQIDQGVTAAATKRGLRPTAIPDITARAREAFKLVNGIPTAFEADGQTA